MIAYQLDKCTDSKRLYNGCLAEQLAIVYRFTAIQCENDTPDPVILAHCVQAGRVLLTTDSSFHYDNQQYLPQTHEGIVIVSNSINKCLTEKDFISSLAKFKAAFLNWHLTQPKNSILQITQHWVELSAIRDGLVCVLATLEFTDPEWQTVLTAKLVENGAVISPQST